MPLLYVFIQLLFDSIFSCLLWLTHCDIHVLKQILTGSRNASEEAVQDPQCHHRERDVPGADHRGQERRHPRRQRQEPS